MRSLSIVALLFLTACSSSRDSATAPGGSAAPAPVGQGPDDPAPAAPPGSPSAPAGDGGAVDPGTPAVVLSGRFDVAQPSAAKAAWPGARIIARFTGSAVAATFSQTPGPGGDATYVNIVVDDRPPVTQRIMGSSTTLELASGLGAGPHTIEIEKRNEPKYGTLTFHGFQFTGGELLPPPPKKTRRIEFIGDSTIDGYGVDGDRNATCSGSTAPPEFDNARKSVAFHAAKALDAEHHLIAASGKGLARNEDGTTNDLFGTLWTRTLTFLPASTWSFASFVPDVVVISLGGADLADVGGGNYALPGDFPAKYAAFVADVRARYGPGPHVFLTVWSQIKNHNGARQALESALDGVADPASKIYRFSFPEAVLVTDETGCQFHANDAHHQAMAGLLAAEIRAKTGWQ